MPVKSLVSFALMILSTQLFGQYVLDTPDGKKVKLNKDGTWTYLTTRSLLNKLTVELPATRPGKYLGKKKRYILLFDEAQWLYDTTQKSNSTNWDVTFYSTDRAISGYYLESRLSMPLDNLEQSVRQQWESAGQIQSFSSHKDTINGLSVVLYDMELLYGGITYQYRGLVQTTSKGSCQFVVGTQKEVFEEDEDKINKLLKGLSPA